MNKLHSHYMTTCYHFWQRSLDECSIHSVILVLKTQPYSKKKENNNNQDPFKDTKKLYMFMGPHKHRRYSLL